MGTITTVGKLLLKNSVPQGFHNFITSTELDKKGTATLFNRMADEAPHDYKDAVSKLTRLGFEISTRLGSTVGLADLVSPIDQKEAFAKLDKELDELKIKFKDKKQYDIEANRAYQKFADDVNRQLIEVGVKKNQTLAKVIRSGSRGSAAQYRQTVFSPVVVQDAKGNVMVDFPVRKSFADGLSLPEYLSATFGARAGEVSKKLAVADAGAFSKELSRGSMTIKVEENDCGTQNGIDVPTDDKDSIGAFLAHGVGGFNRNNEVTGRMLNELKAKAITHLVIRSPITCQSSKKFHSGAVCQLCAGKGAKGLPQLGEHVGITAASGLGESLAQGTLNVKHTSGSATGPNLSGGFALIDQLASVPKTFKNKAAVASLDGSVKEIRPAPQGGTYIHVSDGKKTEEYYVPSGFGLKVKAGDQVEAGDILSEGIVNPAEIVKFKGIGEGRKYWTTSMKKVFDDSGMGGINRRNFEMLSKNMVDHVVITSNDGVGDHLPGEIVSYQAIEREYQPRPGATHTRVDQAYNQYLEEPVLHYTLGTRITKQIIKNLQSRGIENVLVHKSSPGFEPEMQRIDALPMFEPDWMHQLYSTNLERRLLNAVNRGMSSNIRGASPIPGLAYASGFGQKKAEEDTDE